MNFMRSVPGAEPVLFEGLFNASPDRVFRAWTDPEEIKMWFGPAPDSLTKVEVDLRVGGAWCFSFKPGDGVTSSLQGTYLEVEQDARLVFSWSHVRDFDDGRRTETQVSHVTVEFVAEGKATRVKLRHEGIAELDGRQGVGKGWTACYVHLHAMLETEKGDVA